MTDSSPTRSKEMNRPYIICHMTTSIDGKVTGDFLSCPECQGATEIYYDINRTLKSNGFICGRVTMEGSFTGGYYPDLSQYPAEKSGEDFVPQNLSGFYAVAFDTKGRLGWKSDRIIDPDGDPGYDGAQIIEVITTLADERYLGYLRAMGIGYIFAGEREIDVSLALLKLREKFGCEVLLLEGGSIINGAFQRADVIDELSLVVAPLIAQESDKPLFTDSDFSAFKLVRAESKDGNIVMNYKRNSEKESIL